MRRTVLVLSCFAASFFQVACADDSAVKARLIEFLNRGPDVVTEVSRLPVGGLYEAVLADGKIVYTDEAVSYLMIGDLVARNPTRNFTDATRQRLETIDFATLPLAQAFKTVRGSGVRKIATFEDPNCGYCKKLQAELDGLDNVTIYTFPIAVINEDSIGKVKRLWCADNRDGAWRLWMNEGKLPAERECGDVIDANQTLSAKLRISGTPTMFFENGKRITGYVTKDKIDAALNAAIAERAVEALSKKSADKP